jgi:hypothetical protein
MGSRTFDFLTESFLFNEHLLSSDYKSVSERRLAQELRGYRSYCKRQKNQLAGEVLATHSNLKIFISDQRAHTLDFLKQTAFTSTKSCSMTRFSDSGIQNPSSRAC